MIHFVNLTFTMLNPDLFCFENIVDPNQLASLKPADQDPHCFPLCLSIHANNWTNFGGVQNKTIQHVQG